MKHSEKMIKGKSQRSFTGAGSGNLVSENSWEPILPMWDCWEQSSYLPEDSAVHDWQEEVIQMPEFILRHRAKPCMSQEPGTRVVGG